MALSQCCVQSLGSCPHQQKHHPNCLSTRLAQNSSISMAFFMCFYFIVRIIVRAIRTRLMYSHKWKPFLFSDFCAALSPVSFLVTNCAATNHDQTTRATVIVVSDLIGIRQPKQGKSNQIKSSSNHARHPPLPARRHQDVPSRWPLSQAIALPIRLAAGQEGLGRYVPRRGRQPERQIQGEHGARARARGQKQKTN